MRSPARRQRVRKGLLLVSFLLFPATLYWFSPALVLESAALGIAAGSLFVFGGLLVGSVFFGRAFCGWACPGAGVNEALGSLVMRPYAGRGWSSIWWWSDCSPDWPSPSGAAASATRRAGWRRSWSSAPPFGTACACPGSGCVHRPTRASAASGARPTAR